MDTKISFHKEVNIGKMKSKMAVKCDCLYLNLINVKFSRPLMIS